MKKLIYLVLIVFFVFFGIKNIKFDKFTIELVGHRENLKETIEKALEGSTGTYSIAIKNLKTGEEYYRDKERVFDAGSLYKLGVMLAVFEQIEKGELPEDEILTGNVAQINKVLGVSDDEAELKEGTADFTVKNALRQMITISHNYAAVLLTQKVGAARTQDSIGNLGLENTQIDTPDRPRTTARDMLTFFEKVYRKEGVSTYTSTRILDLLLEQELNDRIPKYLPKEARVAHKTGEIDYQKHDAGIVFTPKGDYIIVVLSESDNPTVASERIANLSKGVYEYFKGKN